MVSKSVDPLSRDRWFESAFLQWRLCSQLDFRDPRITHGRNLRPTRDQPTPRRRLRGAIEVRRNNLAGVTALYDRHDLEIH